MPWTHKSKAITVTLQTPHLTSATGLIGRSLGVSSVTFTPLELYGAAARTSHLTAINPFVVTPESEVVRALLEQHVDDTSADFAVLKTANAFKDFVKSYFAGTVAAGIAYLAMIQAGYTWADHFENLLSPGKKSKSPDFVFTDTRLGTALMEAKGTRGTSMHAFETRVSKGYVDQLEPHLGATIGAAVATHGYCIGAHLKSTIKAELRVHHTAVPAVVGGFPSVKQGSGAAAPLSTAVQRGNYARAFLLAHGPQLANEMRRGEQRGSVRFLRFKWRGREWVTGRLGRPFIRLLPFGDIETYGAATFAVEAHIADETLRSFLGVPPGEERPPSIERMSTEFADTTAIAEDARDAAIIYPDGLAVLDEIALPFEEVVWSPDRGFERQ